MGLHLHEDPLELLVSEGLEWRRARMVRKVHHRLVLASKSTVSFCKSHCPLNFYNAFRRVIWSITLSSDIGLTSRLKHSLHCC